MSFDPAALRQQILRHGQVVRVVVASAAGSVPRGPGADMIVWETGQAGTIGGGALELQATQTARRMRPGTSPRIDRIPLGPALSQCCGGAVTLVSEVLDAASLDRLATGAQAGCVLRALDAPPAPPPLAVHRHLAAVRNGTSPATTALLDGWLVEPLADPEHHLWLYGAGHVGQALVQLLAPLPDWHITWVDTDTGRFPAQVPDGVDRMPAAAPALAVPHAPPTAHHLIMTYSHTLDLELCHAVLGHGFATAGLIGSATKWARFRTRLRQLGHSDASIARITCPIGDPTLGKHPHAIAVGVTALLLKATKAISESAMDRRA